jgi:hypothetical protein
MLNDTMRNMKESVQKAFGGPPDPGNPYMPTVTNSPAGSMTTATVAPTITPQQTVKLNTNLLAVPYGERPTPSERGIKITPKYDGVYNTFGYASADQAMDHGKSHSRERFREKADGGLTREDRGSDKKPYPSVASNDFAGGNRSYPIPTKADAIDALRLAGLHGRNDVRAKVYDKYPDLKKDNGGFSSSFLNNALSSINQYNNTSVPSSSNIGWYSNPDQNYGLPAIQTEGLPNQIKSSLPPTPPPSTPATINISKEDLTKAPQERTPFNANAVAMGLKAVALGKSIADALEKPVVEKPMFTDYNASDRQMYGTNVDYTQARQDAMAASNLAANVNRAASSGFNQYQGRMQSTYGNLADQLGQISMNENLQRNQQAMQRGQYETAKAIDVKNTMYQNRIDNLQNLANAKLADQKLFSELSQIGTEFNQYQGYREMLKNNKELSQATINQGLALIGSNYANFGFTKDFIDKIKTGQASVNELVQFMAATDQAKQTKG